MSRRDDRAKARAAKTRATGPAARPDADYFDFLLDGGDPMKWHAFCRRPEYAVWIKKRGALPEDVLLAPSSSAAYPE